jgi:pyruvate,water dikinase
MRCLPLRQADEEASFGGKAKALGEALRAGLEVPDGVALDVECVAAIAGAGLEGGPGGISSWPRGGAEGLVAGILAELASIGCEGPVAVRSSAVGEDSGGTSFAGQHLTRLNVIGAAGLLRAIRDVHASGGAGSALAYRERLGVKGGPKVAVVVQRMIFPEVAGVLFTRNPVTGEDERVVEASWGLGEAVVSGLVTPDRWRMSRDGRVSEASLGEKDIEVVPDGGGTAEREVEAVRAGLFCLDLPQLQALSRLAGLCEEFFAGPSDIEFGFEKGRLHLLQRRPITR